MCGRQLLLPCLSTYKHALKGLTIEEAAHAELPKPLDYIEGAAMFVRAEVFRTIGLFNEEYFLYFEELDLIRRLPSGSHIDWCKNLSSGISVAPAWKARWQNTIQM